MYVLGLNTGTHDSSAALLRDGSLRWFVEQERISRRKHALNQSPAEAIATCLDAEGIGLESVDEIAIGWNFKHGRAVDRPSPKGQPADFMDERVRETLFPEVAPARMPPIRWVSHHLAHAASAYFTAGVDDVAIVVADGTGEDESTSIWHGRNGALAQLRQWPSAQSLGFFYGAAAHWAALGGHWGAGKLMGLAAYGRPMPGLPLARVHDGYTITFDETRNRDWERPWLRPSPMEFHPDYLDELGEHFGKLFPYAPRAGEDAIAYADFAASAQTCLDEAMLGLAAEARRLTGSSVLLLAGGVAMNCSMVGRLVRDSRFDDVFVPPVPTDAGISLGAAPAVAHEDNELASARLEHAYWSTDITADAANEAVRRHGLLARRLSDQTLADHISAVIADNGIVGWARGRGEIGQRALGARSILADPRDRRNLERLNTIKGREMWRPVAPSVLGERMAELISGPTADPTRFMLQAAVVRPDARNRIPAVTHVDGSARPQSVEHSTNPGFCLLIEQFRQRTGVPALINTSFNLAGEPIVCSATDAVETFVKAERLDLLVLGDLLIARSEADLTTVADGEKTAGW